MCVRVYKERQYFQMIKSLMVMKMHFQRKREKMLKNI